MHHNRADLWGCEQAGPENVGIGNVVPHPVCQSVVRARETSPSTPPSYLCQVGELALRQWKQGSCSYSSPAATLGRADPRLSLSSTVKLTHLVVAWVSQPENMIMGDPAPSIICLMVTWVKERCPHNPCQAGELGLRSWEQESCSYPSPGEWFLYFAWASQYNWP